VRAHVSAENEFGDDFFGVVLIFGKEKKVERRVVFEDFPEHRDVHVFED
jgi:hypothetical protein